MADVLMLRREHRPTRIELAVRGALAGGAHAGRAVGFLACQAARPPPPYWRFCPGISRRSSRPIRRWTTMTACSPAGTGDECPGQRRGLPPPPANLLLNPLHELVALRSARAVQRSLHIDPPPGAASPATPGGQPIP